MARTALPASYWAFDLLDPAHLVQSRFLGTAGLLILHAVTVLYSVATILVDVLTGAYLCLFVLAVGSLALAGLPCVLYSTF